MTSEHNPVISCDQNWPDLDSQYKAAIQVNADDGPGLCLYEAIHSEKGPTKINTRASQLSGVETLKHC